MRMRSILSTVATALFVLAGGTAASAQVLPLIVDGSGETDVTWWMDSGYDEASPFSEAMKAASRSQISLPSEVAADQQISRIYQRSELTVTNAANLGRLFGQDYVLHGTLRAGSRQVPAAGEHVARLELDSVLIDTRTLAVVGEIDLVAYGAEESSASSRQQAAQNLVDSLDERLKLMTGRRSATPDEHELRVTIEGTGSALPFVHFRRNLREVLGERGALMECAATEGSVTLCLSLEDPGLRSAIADDVRSLEGQFIENDIKVERVEANLQGLVVKLADEQTPETPDLPFP
jgi:hypothetical protein